MKYVVRPEIWESNSSMSHSCIILPKRLSEKWKNNEDMYYYYGEILSIDELKERILNDGTYSVDDIKSIEDEDIKEAKWKDLIYELRWDDVATYEDWISDFGDYYDNVDTTEYTSESGDEIVIHCKYGSHY